MTTQTRNVFISHIHKDDDHLEDLKGLLRNGGLEVRDSSINSSKPNDANSPSYIKSEILAPSINWASTLIVYISPETKNSDWVNWEIEYACKQGKRIVGVWERGAKGCEVPEALDLYADAIVGWNSNNIIAAINGDERFEMPDGSPCAPRSIKRHRCS